MFLSEIHEYQTPKSNQDQTKTLVTVMKGIFGTVVYEINALALVKHDLPKLYVQTAILTRKWMLATTAYVQMGFTQIQELTVVRYEVTVAPLVKQVGYLSVIHEQITPKRHQIWSRTLATVMRGIIGMEVYEISVVQLVRYDLDQRPINVPNVWTMLVKMPIMNAFVQTVMQRISAMVHVPYANQTPPIQYERNVMIKMT